MRGPRFPWCSSSGVRCPAVRVHLRPGGVREHPCRSMRSLDAVRDPAKWRRGGLHRRGARPRPRRRGRCPGLPAHPSALDRLQEVCASVGARTPGCASRPCTGSGGSPSAISRSSSPPRRPIGARPSQPRVTSHRHPQGRGAHLEAPRLRGRQHGMGGPALSLSSSPGDIRDEVDARHGRTGPVAGWWSRSWRPFSPSVAAVLAIVPCRMP